MSIVPTLKAFTRSLVTRGLMVTSYALLRYIWRFLDARGLWRRVPAPICDSVQEWAAQHPTAQLFELVPSQKLVRRLPQSLEQPTHVAFVRAQNNNVPEKYLARLPQAELRGADGLVFLSSGCYAREWAFSRELLSQAEEYRMPSLRPRRYMKGNYYSLFWIHWSNYFHWLHDSLLRLYRISEFVPPDTRFIVPANLPPRWQESLACLGLPSAQLVEYDGESVWRLENLFFSSYTKRASYDLPVELDWFRRRIWQNAGISEPKRAKRIYISRERAAWRKIVNEAQVRECVASFGFESHVLEALTFQEQVKLFSQAEIVVGCHGAGNANMLFAPPHATMIEIFSPNYVQNSYWSMCDGLDVTYWYLTAHAAPTTDPTRNPGYPLEDIRVPLDALSQIIERVLQNNGERT